MRLAILLLLVGCSEARREPQITIGQVREVEVKTLATPTDADFQAALKMHAAGDELGLAQAVVAKRLLSLGPGTRVRLLDYDEVGPCQVRVESGDHVGAAVWIPTNAYLLARKH